MSSTMRIYWRIVVLVILLVTAAGSGVMRPGVAADVESRALPRSAPEAQGIDSAALLEFINAANEKVETMNSILLVRHGHVVAEGYWSPYNAETRHALYSLTKSFTSSAIGLAVAEGKLSIDDLVLPLFPEDAPAEPGANLKALRVRDLLTMSVGHHAEASNRPGEDWTRNFLAQPVEHKPGTYFLYNTPGSHMLSAIVQKATGLTTLEYLRPRLFAPLGIEDPVWMSSPQGVTSGGWGLKLRTREIARFGQLYLQKGRWQGRQLLPASWVETATARQVSNGSNPASDWEQGYAFQFWRCRHRIFRGDGAFGQYCVIMPEQDAVLVITSGVKNMQSVLDLVWERLLPVFKEKPLPANAARHQQLNRRLADLKVRTAEGAATSALASGISGKFYKFPVNELKIDSIALNAGASGETTLTIRRNGSDQPVVIGHGEWKKGTLAYGEWPSQPVAASGAWIAPDLYLARLCFYEEPFILDLRLKFENGKVVFDGEFNVYFRGPTKQPRLVGG